ncbi:amidase, partial [Streptomyces sp. Wh19]|nr:amidase [Streptomyces sp. Wh19]
MSSTEAVETSEPAGPTGLADSARELAEGLTTSVEQVTAALRRIEASQSTLNAFRHLRAEAALAEAAEADRRLAAGER